MLSAKEFKRFNTALTSRYGLLKEGQPLFRLVWTTDQTEIVVGDYEVRSPAGIFLRVERGAHRRRKYPLILDRYVLETWTVAPPDLPEKPYTYEGIYFFQDKDGNYLEPIEEVVSFVAKQFLLAQNYKPLTDAAVDAMTKEEDEKAEQYFLDVLENETPYEALKLGWGEAVVNPHGPAKIGGKDVCAQSVP